MTEMMSPSNPVFMLFLFLLKYALHNYAGSGGFI